MTPHEHMNQHVRTMTGGAIAWERHVFNDTAELNPHDLVDAAVDIAWTRLMPDTLERPHLEIERKGKLIIFRVRTYSLEQVIGKAA